METIFEFDSNNYHDCQNNYQGPRNQEYYLGDYSIESGSEIDVRAHRKSIGSLSIVRNQSKNRQSFRRSLSHIRQDATDVTVFWFVNRGCIRVTHQCGSDVANEGGVMVTKSLTPFFMDCQTDNYLMHDAYQLIVPTHILRRFLADDLVTGVTMPAGKEEIVLAEKILAYLFELDGDEVEENTECLMDSVLSLICKGIRNSRISNPARQSVADMRLQDVLRFIDNHLSDPNLSINMVSKGCGISPRYMSHLLKSQGILFSIFVWEQRLKIAVELISSSEPTELFISEIAYRVGFKSAAHFSRMFKRVHKVSPREYRSVDTMDNAEIVNQCTPA